jgi:type II secretory pathway pseudopilin PulG
VNKIYMKMRRTVHDLKNSRDGSGFSMLEAVVVVGVLLALAVGGFLSYGQITENAKIAKVKSTASEVYTAVMVSHIDGDSTTSASKVIREFNNSNDKIRVSIREGKLISPLAAMPTDEYEPKTGDDFCITATMIAEERVFAEIGACSIPENESELPGSGDSDGEPSEETPDTGDESPSENEETEENDENEQPPATEPPVVEEPTVDPSPAPEVPKEYIWDNEAVMTTVWDTSIAQTCEQITLPISGEKTGAMIDWGDGKGSQPFYLQSPNYGNVGEVNITVSGNFDKWGKETGSAWTDSNCLTKVSRWGNTGTKDLKFAFIEANNLTLVKAIPESTNDLNGAFFRITGNPDISGIRTPNVQNMSSMFNNATNFNQPLHFDTSKVTTMSSMFISATKFDQPINFDTSNVQNMSSMFAKATSFNQPLNLNTPQLSNVSSMFADASNFNKSLKLNTSNLVNMSGMFSGAKTFNQPIDFNTANVKDMNSMFMNAAKFNQPVVFNTAKVTLMPQMFYGASEFNHPLNFNTLNVTNMSGMFWGATNFNHPLNFTTSKVWIMNNMFRNATKFNQNLSAWNVSTVTLQNRSNFATDAVSWTLPKPTWK